MEAPNWPKKAKQSVAENGKVDLSGEHIEDLSSLGTHKLMRELNLSYVQIPNIDRLKPQPNLNTFIADGSSITSLLNFKSIQTIKKISMKNTPVSTNPNFIISILLVCPHVTVVNGKLVSNIQKSRSQKYPPICSELVNRGWMASYPPPDEYKIDELCKKFNIPTQLEEPHEQETIPEEEEEYVNLFEKNIQEFYKIHDRLVNNARRRCGLKYTIYEEEEEFFEEEESNQEPLEEEEIQMREALFDDQLEEEEIWDTEEDNNVQLSLVERLANVLAENGIKVDESNLEESILNAIDSLCLEREEADSLQSDQ